MDIKDYFLRKLIMFSLIMLFWLPFFIAVFREIRRAYSNICFLSQIKYEYRIWLKVLNQTRNYSAKDKVDKLHE